MNRVEAWTSFRHGIFVLLQTRHIDDKAVSDIAFQHSFVSLIDLLYRYDLDVGGYAMLGTKVQHLLRFPYAAYERSGQAAASHN